MANGIVIVSNYVSQPQLLLCYLIYVIILHISEYNICIPQYIYDRYMDPNRQTKCCAISDKRLACLSEFLDTIMALLKCFPVTKSLPDPNGPLFSTVKPKAIESAKSKVSEILV